VQGQSTNTLDSLTESSKNNVKKPLKCHICHSEENRQCNDLGGSDEVHSFMDEYIEHDQYKRESGHFLKTCGENERYCMVGKMELNFLHFK